MPATPGRFFANDVELGKKDDEYRPGVDGKLPSKGLDWPGWRFSNPRLRKRRLFIAIVAFVVVLLFIRNIPTDLTPAAYRIDRRMPFRTINGRPLNGAPLNGAPSKYVLDEDEAPLGAPPMEDPNDNKRLGQHYYDGRIRWYNLARSLQTASRSMGYLTHNKNVMFAAAGAQSLGRLIPMACEMARWNRNLVHIVIMGRDDLTIDEYKEINGVDKTCGIFWHDARPDYAPYSTDERLYKNTWNALSHVHNFLHPQVYIMDDPEEEEIPFTKGLEYHARNTWKTVIQLPKDAVSSLMWITRLDTGSLSEWHNTYIEILIHAPPHSSGSLIRLLRSIENARYLGFRHPHITIELPFDLDQPTENFLENFIWPPLPQNGGPHASQLTIRRRITPYRTTPTEASIRQIESFYPSRIDSSHVFVLSHEVELSELYYHYLMYQLLEYKYASYGQDTWEFKRLMGISLNLPPRLLDDKTKLIPPSSADNEEFDNYTPFLWQAPDAHATLYFGDKWREFHSFLSYRLSKPTSPLTKVVSSNFPAFVEHLLELMRAHNYFVLYPHVPKYSMATVHNELYNPPPEFVRNEPSEEESEEVNLEDLDEPFIIPPPATEPPPSKEEKLSTAPLHRLLPNDADLPELGMLPMLSHAGRITPATTLSKFSRSYLLAFRSTIGECSSTYNFDTVMGSMDDMFCYDIDTYANQFAPRSGDRAHSQFYQGAKERMSYEDIPRDEFGDVIPPPLPDEEIKSMAAEFQIHLQRQSKQARGEYLEKPSSNRQAETNVVREARGKGDDTPSTEPDTDTGKETNHGDDDVVVGSQRPVDKDLKKLPNTGDRELGQAADGKLLGYVEPSTDDSLVEQIPNPDSPELPDVGASR